MAHGDEHVGVGDQVFELDFVDLVHDLRAPVVAVLLLYFLQLARDHVLEFFLTCQNLFEFDNFLANGFQFLENLIDRELRQAV